MIRTLCPADLPSVLRIQAACYTELEPESLQSLAAKQRAASAFCFVACRDAEVVAYLFSLPWIAAAPPALNAADCQLPLDPDCLYLHDLAVLPTARQTGAGKALVQAFFACLAKLALQQANLIAVQGAAGYWRRYGFQPVQTTATLEKKLATYGEDVVYMQYLKPVH